MSEYIATLRARESTLRDQLSTVKSLLREAEKEKFLAESEFKVGDDVIHYGRRFRVASVGHWGAPYFMGKLILKSGGLGKVKSRLYGTLTRAGDTQ